MTADEVVVELTAKVSEFKADMVGARAAFLKETGAIEKGALSMSDHVRLYSHVAGTALRVGLTGALLAVPVALIGAIDKGLEFAASLKVTAEQVGVTAQELQEYRYAASQVGISNESLDRGLQFLTRNFGLAQTGAKRPIEALHDLGFSVQEIARIIHTDAGQALPELADKFAALPTPARQAGDAVKLFGRQGQQLLPLLTQGSAGINALRDAAQKLGIVLSDEQIERAHQAEVKFKALKEVLSAQIAGAVASNADAIINLTNQILRLTTAAIQAIPRLQLFFNSMAQGRAQIALAEDVGHNALLGPFGDTQGRRQQILADQENVFDLQVQRARLQASQQHPARVPGAKLIPNEFGPRNAEAPPIPKITDADVKGVSDALKSADKQKKLKDTIDHFLEEQATIQQRINTADAAIAGTDAARAIAEKKNIDEQEAREIARIQASDEYTKAQKASLIAEAKFAAAREKEAIDAAEEQKRFEEGFKVREADVQNESDLLKAQEALTDDRRKRADIEKRLVDLAIEQERLQLEEIVQSKTTTDAEKMIAQDRLNMLDDLKGLQEKAVDKQNASPGQQYLADLNTHIGSVNDTIQSLEVENLKKLDDYLSAGVAHALGLKGALGEVVTELIRIGIEKEVIQPIANALFGGGGGLGGLFGGLFGGGSGASSIGALFGGGGDPTSMASTLGLLGYAGGGGVNAGQPILVGEKGPELFTPNSNGSIVPNDFLGGRQSIVEVRVVGGENFEAHIVKVTGPVIARASMQAAVGGSQLARQTIYQDARNRLE